jgi:hypothetical protein
MFCLGHYESALAEIVDQRVATVSRRGLSGGRAGRTCRMVSKYFNIYSRERLRTDFFGLPIIALLIQPRNLESAIESRTRRLVNRSIVTEISQRGQYYAVRNDRA